MSAQDPDRDYVDPEAQRVFDEFLRQEEPEGDLNFETLCAQHPELADALRRLYSTHLKHRQGTISTVHLHSPNSNVLLNEIEKLAGKTASDPGIRPPPGIPLEQGGGSILGDFQILGQLGTGGQGIVYIAEQLSLGRRRCALKVLSAGAQIHQEVIDFFQKESEIAAHLDHPNIVPIYASGRAEGQYYFGMKYIEGVTLAEVIEHLRFEWLRERETKAIPPGSEIPAEIQRVRLQAIDAFLSGPRRGEVPEDSLASLRERISGRRFGDPYFRRLAEFTAEVADGLSYAHRRGIVHRDIKPGNIMVDRNGVPLITDFGLAIELEGRTVAWTGEAGTPYYMSPEQISAEKIGLDHRTDIYSLGVTLYELATLECPYTGKTRGAVYRNILVKEPPRPRKVNPRVPNDLQTIILKAMEKDPDRRYQRAADLAADLRAFAAGQPIAANPQGPLRRGWRFLRRQKKYVAAGMLAIVIFYLIQYLVMPESRRPLVVTGFVLSDVQSSAGLPDEFLRTTGDLLNDLILKHQRNFLYRQGSPWLPVYDESFASLPPSPLRRDLERLWEACRARDFRYLLFNEYLVEWSSPRLSEESLEVLKKGGMSGRILAQLETLKGMDLSDGELRRRLPENSWAYIPEILKHGENPVLQVKIISTLKRIGKGDLSEEKIVGPFSLQVGREREEQTTEQCCTVLRRLLESLDVEIPGEDWTAVHQGLFQSITTKLAAAALPSAPALARVDSWEEEYRALFKSMGGRQ